jgi:hypothetical protein
VAEVVKTLVHKGVLRHWNPHELLCDIGYPDLALRVESIAEELAVYRSDGDDCRIAIICGPCATPEFRAAVDGRRWTPDEAIAERPLPCRGPSGPQAGCRCRYQPMGEPRLNASWRLVDWPDLKATPGFPAFQQGCMADFRDMEEEAVDLYRAAMLQSRNPDGSLAASGFPACQNLAALCERIGQFEEAARLSRLAIQVVPRDLPGRNEFLASSHRILARVASHTGDHDGAARFRDLAVAAEELARREDSAAIGSSPSDGDGLVDPELRQIVVMIR